MGDLISTAQDQLRYARFHLGDGTTEDATRLLQCGRCRSSGSLRMLRAIRPASSHVSKPGAAVRRPGSSSK